MSDLLENARILQYYDYVKQYWETHRVVSEPDNFMHYPLPIHHHNLMTLLSSFRRRQHPWSDALMVAAFHECYPSYASKASRYYWGEIWSLFHPNSTCLHSQLEKYSSFSLYNTRANLTYANISDAYAFYVSCYDAIPSAIRADLLRTVFRS